jgi:hypothetical protein
MNALDKKSYLFLRLTRIKQSTHQQVICPKNLSIFCKAVGDLKYLDAAFLLKPSCTMQPE